VTITDDCQHDGVLLLICTRHLTWADLPPTCSVVVGSGMSNRIGVWSAFTVWEIRWPCFFLNKITNFLN
jgi:hypothetical protein